MGTAALEEVGMKPLAWSPPWWWQEWWGGGGCLLPCGTHSLGSREDSWAPR